jgi:hypothetical protein
MRFLYDTPQDVDLTKEDPNHWSRWNSVKFTISKCGNNCGIKVMSDILFERYKENGPSIRKMAELFKADVEMIKKMKHMFGDRSLLKRIQEANKLRKDINTSFYMTKQELITLADGYPITSVLKLLNFSAIAMPPEEINPLSISFEPRERYALPFTSLIHTTKLVITDHITENELPKDEQITSGRFTGQFCKHVGLEQIGKIVKNSNSGNEILMWEWNI